MKAGAAREAAVPPPAPTPALTLAGIAGLFAGHGAAWYGGESVTQTEHALQCARLAEAAGEPPALVAAALLHDIGHLLEAADGGQDDLRHQDLAARALAPLFGPEVTEPIRLHVPAERYLCAVDPAYGGRLSPASVHSLALQGGPYDAARARAFEQLPHAGAAIRLRRYDDMAKVPGADTPALEHYLAVASALARASSSRA